MTAIEPRNAREVDVVVVGAGFAGLYAHHRLREEGFSAAGFEAAPAVGGTWYWNAYPGARCDVESLDYTYSFIPDLLDAWRWSERFATQPEILRYINHVADRLDLRRDITFGTRVTSTRFDERTARWHVETDCGHHVTARFVIAAVGCLSVPRVPQIEGLEDFGGRWVQTGDWPRDPVEIAGKRAAVIGTGSSGIQSIPVIAAAAGHLTVFQRTPNFSLPARNGAIDPAHEAAVRADYADHCRRNKDSRGGVESKFATGLSALEISEVERTAKFEDAWSKGSAGLLALFRDLLTDEAANATAADFVRAKIKNIVKDPEVAERLTPRNHPFGTKRICLDSDYYATFNRASVDLVDIRATPIERITAHGIQTNDRHYPVDLIVFATGFDAMTGPLLALNIAGVGGRTLREAWRDGPATFLGFAVAGFPNLFAVTGPGSPSVLTNMLPTIEHHVDWIVRALAYMRANRIDAIEALPDAQDDWVAQVREAANATLYPLAKSWYNGDNIPGKPRVFMAYVGGLNTFINRCDTVAAAGYPGFSLSTIHEECTQTLAARFEDSAARRLKAVASRNGAPQWPRDVARLRHRA